MKNICRLCNGTSSPSFSLKVLNKNQVAYQECQDCGALQTEPPYWLEEAYANANLSSLDTGAAQRCLNNLAVVFAISKLFNATNVLDIGGGDGLLCRLLRDHGINCFSEDKYAKPTYAQGFTEKNFDIPDLTIAFEVIEHFTNPREEIDILFKGRPKIVLISTDLYKKQGNDWWYLSPESGQHVFFYTEKSLRFIAKKYGYVLVHNGNLIVFIKNPTALEKTLSLMLLKNRLRPWIRGFLAMRDTPNTWADHLLLLKKLR